MLEAFDGSTLSLNYRKALWPFLSKLSVDILMRFYFKYYISLKIPSILITESIVALSPTWAAHLKKG